MAPPNRALVMELVSPGSLWEALREDSIPSVRIDVCIENIHTLLFYNIALSSKQNRFDYRGMPLQNLAVHCIIEAKYNHQHSSLATISLYILVAARAVLYDTPLIRSRMRTPRGRQSECPYYVFPSKKANINGRRNKTCLHISYNEQVEIGKTGR